jgi:uncharacterized protein (TIGR02145 family)
MLWWYKLKYRIQANSTAFKKTALLAVFVFAIGILGTQDFSGGSFSASMINNPSESENISQNTSLDILKPILRGEKIAFNIPENTTVYYSYTDMEFECGKSAVFHEGIWYSTQSIGEQCWIQENLKHEPISGSSWCNGSCNTDYGRYYNRAAAVSQNLCPTGFHLPSQAIYQSLGTVKSDLIASGWFLGTYPGYFLGSSFYQVDNQASFWTASWNSSYNRPIYATIEKNANTFIVSSSWSNKSAYGYSVRCIQNENILSHYREYIEPIEITESFPDQFQLLVYESSNAVSPVLSVSYVVEEVEEENNNEEDTDEIQPSEETTPFYENVSVVTPQGPLSGVLSMSLGEAFSLTLQDEDGNIFPENISWDILQNDEVLSLSTNSGSVSLVTASTPGVSYIQVQATHNNTPVYTKVFRVIVERGMRINGRTEDFQTELSPETEYTILVTGIVNPLSEGFFWRYDNVKGTIKEQKSSEFSPYNDSITYTAPKMTGISPVYDFIEAVTLTRTIKITLVTLPGSIEEISLLPPNEETLTASVYKIPLGKKSPLKIKTIFEGGREVTWQSGESMPSILVNPVWTLIDPELASVDASGFLVPKKLGASSVYVQIGSDKKDNQGMLIEIAPTAHLSFEVVAPFTVNSQFAETIEHDISAGSKYSLRVSSHENNPVSARFVNNTSGATLLYNEETHTYEYTAGTVSGHIDKIEFTDTNNILLTYLFTVSSPVFTDITVSATKDFIEVGNIVPLEITYTLSGENENTVISNTQSLPSVLSYLQYTSSDESVVSVESHFLHAKKAGDAQITVSTGTGGASTSFSVKVENSTVVFTPGSLQFTPQYVAINGKVRVETELSFEEGIEKIEKVEMICSSPLQVRFPLYHEEEFFARNSSRTGIQDTISSEFSFSGQKKARFIGEYQLTGNPILEGKQVVCSVQAYSEEGTVSPHTQTGTLFIGSSSSLCTPQNKYLCLLKGLQCLKDREQAGCDQIILQFTQNPQTFNVLDVFNRYKQLR